MGSDKRLTRAQITEMLLISQVSLDTKASYLPSLTWLVVNRGCSSSPVGLLQVFHGVCTRLKWAQTQRAPSGESVSTRLFCQRSQKASGCQRLRQAPGMWQKHATRALLCSEGAAASPLPIFSNHRGLLLTWAGSCSSSTPLAVAHWGYG